MTDDDGLSEVRKAIAEGLEQDAPKRTAVLSALGRMPIDQFGLLREGVAFLKKLVRTETPDDPGQIGELSKEEMIHVTYRVNFFEKLRHPAVDDAQLECLLNHAHELWGEHPTEPVGRWVDWSLWMHLNRRRNGIPIAAVLAGNKTTEELKEEWMNRHLERVERRNLQKVENYERYGAPEDVPPSLRQLVLSPLIEEPEVAAIEIETDDLPVEEPTD